MANKATMKINATLLPDEIQKVISNANMSYEPASANEGWYYALTDIQTADQQLIFASSYIQKGASSTQGGVNTGGTPTSIAAGSDIVKFLVIKHTSVQGDGTANTADSIYLTFDNTAAASSETDSFEIGPGELWYAKINTPVDEIQCIVDEKGYGAGSAQGEVQAQVFAVIKDV